MKERNGRTTLSSIGQGNAHRTAQCFANISVRLTGTWSLRLFNTMMMKEKTNSVQKERKLLVKSKRIHNTYCVARKIKQNEEMKSTVCVWSAWKRKEEEEKSIMIINWCAFANRPTMTTARRRDIEVCHEEENDERQPASIILSGASLLNEQCHFTELMPMIDWLRGTVDHAAQFGRFLFQLRNFQTQFHILLFQNSRSTSNEKKRARQRHSCVEQRRELPPFTWERFHLLLLAGRLDFV